MIEEDENVTFNKTIAKAVQQYSFHNNSSEKKKKKKKETATTDPLRRNDRIETKRDEKRHERLCILLAEMPFHLSGDWTMFQKFRRCDEIHLF